MRFFILIYFLTLFIPVQGSQIHVLKKSDGMSIIGSRIEIFEDKTTNLEIKDILKSEYQKQFKKSETEIPLFNVTWSAIWIKMTFTTTENQNWYLYWGMPSAQYVTLYKIAKSEIQESKSGIRIPSNERQMLGHTIAFPLDLQPGDTTVYYLRIYDIAPLRAIIKTGTLEDLFEMDFKINFWAGIIYGLMLLMVLYNIFLYFTNKKRVYIFYALFVVMNTIFIAFFSGYMTSFPDSFLLVFVYFPVLFPAGFGIFGLLFTMDFLNTKKHVPNTHKVIKIFCYTAATPLLFCFFGEQRMSIITIQILGLALGVICITTGLKVLLKGYKPAKFYVIGFGAYMGGLMLLIGADLMGKATEFTSQYSLLIGAAIEAVMLSFAIGDKLNNATREKQLAQAEALHSAQENAKLVSEQNVMLEQKVKERTAEVVHQKEIIEEKQKEIIDSINYAQRLQQAILAPKSEIDHYLPQNFLLYKPKDIVAGDFYFFETTDTHIFYAAADCTGHGVPGAMVSLVCSNALTRCVKEFELTDPGKILDKTREMILETFQKSGEDVKDGMDISFIAIDKKTNEIMWSGANNPLWYIENGEMKEIKANKQPIGKTDNPQPFTTHVLPISSTAEAMDGARPLSTVFLLTDGFADQFGGPKGKKFKYSNLQKLLLENFDKEINLQSQILNQEFEEWKGDLEQVDDVCIIGIRI